MPNTITAFLETLVAESGEYNAATVGAVSFLDGILMDVKPEAARMGQTLKVIFPDLGAFADISSSGHTDEALNPGEVDMVFNTMPGKSFTVDDFEQWQTSVEIREKFMDPLYKRAMEFLNGQIAALVTSGNFSQSVTAMGAGAYISPRDVARAKNKLMNSKVPVSDEGAMSLFLHNDVYTNMLPDSSWTQESLVGAVQADSARQSGNLRRAYGATQRWDQQAPRTATALTGTCALTNGSAAVVGTSTLFTTELAVGDNVLFTDDVDERFYKVASITDNTHLTLTVAYASATDASTAATRYRYQALLAHKFAIGCALRPLPKPDGKVVEWTYVNLKGIPLRVQIGYHQVPKSGYTVTADFGYALKVLRSTFGCRIVP